MTKHADFLRRTLKALHAELAHAVRIRTGGSGTRCPCCNNPMQQYRKSVLRNKTPRDYPTVAHNFPTALGGNPVVWVYACHGCNNDQGAMPLLGWGLKLQRRGDPRGDRVVELALFIEKWCAERSIPIRLERQRSTPPRLSREDEQPCS